MFPMRRTDGSACVSARFEIASPELVDLVARRTAAWFSSRPEIQDDFRAAPVVRLVDGDRVEVVLELRPGSQRWKDWLVDVTRTLDASSGLSFTGFHDLVGDRPHPASIPRTEPA